MLANMDKYLVDRLLRPTHGAEQKKTTTRKRGRSSSTSSSSSATSTKKKQKRQRTTTKRITYTPKGGSWWKGKGKGKGKGKRKRTHNSKGYGKGKGWGKSKKGRKGWGKYKDTPLPKELQGLNANTKAGDPKCIGWNMQSGCNQAPGGQRCWKGLHVCMKCGSSTHGAHACKDNDKK